MQSWLYEKLGSSQNGSISDKHTGRLKKVNRIEFWYLSYAILGCTMGGMVPILIPLLAFKRFSSACYVGLVMGAFNLGGLLTPIFGSVADRFGIHRELLCGALIMTAIALGTLTFTNNFSLWLALALIQGIGMFVAMTVGNLFIVEIHPKSEWNERISRLQLFNCGGQVGGMLLAAGLSQINLRSSLLIAASLVALAVLPSCLTPKVSPQRAMSRSAGLCNFDQCDWTRELSHLQFFGDKLNIFRNLNFACNKPFEHFMGIWFLCITGATAVFTLYPIMMQELYGIGQKLLSLNFAIAMGISVFLYDWAGHLSHRFGPMRILQSFLGVRLIAFLAFLLPGMFHFNGSVKLILLSFSVVVLCWPFIIVSGTALAALLFPSGEGKGMGIFYAVLALACISGSTIGGWLAAQWGFTATAGMAVITESLGLIFIYKTGGEKAVNTAISQVSDVQQQLNRW